MQSPQPVQGKWRGFYTYDSPVVTAIRGQEKTFFTIVISETVNGKFTGTVQDDVASGGMEEEGQIEGSLDGGVVLFKKRMPVHSMLMPDGTSKKTNKPHPVIFYRGEYFPLEKKMRGEWKIKGRIFFHQRRLYLTRRATGRWEMTMTGEPTVH